MFDSIVQLVTDNDTHVLASAGIGDVSASDVAPFPTLDFTHNGNRYQLLLDPAGVSQLTAGDELLCEFTYSSSLETMRYTLAGWNDHHPVHRRAIAYMVAMQRNAVAESALAHSGLFQAA